MPEPNVIQRLSEDVFDLVLNRLIHDQKFRQIFFNDPENAIEGLGFQLTAEQVNALRNLDGTDIPKDMINFNEKLVLCSSSGY